MGSEIDKVTEDIGNGIDDVFHDLEDVAEDVVDTFEYDYFTDFGNNPSGPFRRLSNGERRAASAVQSNLGRGRGGD